MIIPFLVAASVGVLLTPAVIFIARKTKVYDTPSSDKIHDDATPMLGGLAVWLATSVTVFIFAPSPFALMAVVSSALIAAVGLYDDIRPMGPHLKLLAMIPGVVAALILWPEALHPVMYIVFGLLFLSVVNSVNLLDTIDGLTGAMSAISAAAYGVIALIAGAPHLAVYAFCLTGACLAFLIFNYRIKKPALVFLGDMGSLGIGAMLFVLPARLMHFASGALDVIAVAGPLALVMTNALLTMGVRKLNGHKALARTKDHISERLYTAGMAKWEVTLWLALVTAISAAAGVGAWVATETWLEIVSIVAGLVAIITLAAYAYSRESANAS